MRAGLARSPPRVAALVGAAALVGYGAPRRRGHAGDRRAARLADRARRRPARAAARRSAACAASSPPIALVERRAAGGRRRAVRGADVRLAATTRFMTVLLAAYAAALGCVDGARGSAAARCDDVDARARHAGGRRRGPRATCAPASTGNDEIARARPPTSTRWWRGSTTRSALRRDAVRRRLARPAHADHRAAAARQRDRRRRRRRRARAASTSPAWAPTCARSAR